MSDDSHIDPTHHDPDEALEGEGAAAPQPPKTGNRPAEGAQQKLPGEVFTDSFVGSENAGDFLGLDLEFTSAELSHPFSETPPPGVDPAPAAGELDLTPAPTVEAAPVEDYDAEYDLEGPTHIMHVDDGLEDEDDLEAYGEEGVLEGDEGEYGELDDEEDEYGLFGEDGEDSKSSRKGLLIGAFAAGLVMVVGVQMLPDTSAPVDPAPVVGQVAVSGESPTPEPPIGATVETVPDVSGALPVTGTEIIEGPIEDPVLASDPVETYVDPQPEPVEVTDPASAFQTDLLSGVSGAAVGDPGANPGQVDSFPNFDEGFEWISEDKLDMVWRGQDIPLAAVGAPAKTLMPRVGDVRVHTTSGEIIEGRLYAVGQDRVWLEIEGGRLGLDGDTVERFERLAVEASLSGAGPLVGARVRVALPGGSLTGRVMAQNDERLTLVTPDGAKITVDGAEVETIGNGRAVVIQN